jgi:hypothetical protein
MPTDVAAALAAKTNEQSDGRLAVTLLLACLLLCLSNVVAVLSSPVMAEAMELLGQY